MKLYRADGQQATIAECIDAAREQLVDARTGASSGEARVTGAGRAFSESITLLETGRMWSNRAFCELRGEVSDVDMQRTPTILPREL